MPIYEYRCSSCSHQEDFLQKLSEPQLTDCPKCGKSTFAKQVTAAGFQLKGSGWYATDFKNNGTSGKSGGSSESTSTSSGSSESSTSEAAPACGSGACSACS
jgi:putative FmdB family regulatory protein